MGFFAFGAYALLTICIAAFIVWAAGKLAPNHPVLYDNIIWVLAGFIIVFELAGALGLHDVAIPKVFGR